jgi:diguanylate cyclase (GGDEF)-like protein
MDSVSESLPKPPAFRQVDGGGASHRFDEPLENEFHEVYLAANLTVLRGALLIGFLFGLTVLAYDYWIAEFGFSSWSVQARTIVSLPLVLAMFLASFHPNAHKFLTLLGIAVGLSIAAIFLLLSTFAEGQTMGSTFTAYVVVTFYIYLFLGQRFWPAIITAMALFVSFMAAISLQGEIADMMIFGTFLMFINLVSATCLYCHEKYHRRMFLEAKALKKLASLDALTGLPNRRTLDEYLNKIWSYAKRESQPIALALIDIDHFKAYNDNYGHQAGDQSLIAVAQILEKTMRRPLDLAARFGGEEFVALLTGSSAQDAEWIINSMRLEVQAQKIPHETSPTAAMITISAGLAHLYPSRTDHSLQGFIQLADQALYQAKNNGRNRVYLSGDQDDIDTKTGFFQLKSFKVAK